MRKSLWICFALIFCLSCKSFASGFNQISRYGAKKAGNWVGKQIEKDFHNKEQRLTEQIIQQRAKTRATTLETLYKALNNKKLNKEQQRRLLDEVTNRLGNPQDFYGHKLTTVELVERVKEGSLTTDDLKAINEFIKHPDLLDVPEVIPEPLKRDRAARWFGQWVRFLTIIPLGVVVFGKMAIHR